MRSFLQGFHQLSHISLGHTTRAGCLGLGNIHLLPREFSNNRANRLAHSFSESFHRLASFITVHQVSGLLVSVVYSFVGHFRFLSLMISYCLSLYYTPKSSVSQERIFSCCSK